MKVVIQRVLQAEVKVAQKRVAKIGRGMLVFLGIGRKDNSTKLDWLANKLLNLRIFADKNSKMNLTLKDINGEILLVSQFTLYGNTTKGNRPSFIEAGKPLLARSLYNKLIKKLKGQKTKVATGVFGAEMQISLVNDGPVTLVIEK